MFSIEAPPVPITRVVRFLPTAPVSYEEAEFSVCAQRPVAVMACRNGDSGPWASLKGQLHFALVSILDYLALRNKPYLHQQPRRWRKKR